MALLSAKQLLAQETEEFPITIGGGEVLVKRPDLQLMVLQGLMPATLFTQMLGLVKEWLGNDVGKTPDSVIEQNETLLDFINRFCCAALVHPKAVMTEEELTDDAILISRVTLATRRQIMVDVSTHISKAQSEVRAAALEFPEGGPRAGAGQDVQAVSPAAV